MRGHSIPPALIVSFLLVSTSPAQLRQAELYVDIERVVAGANGSQIVDVIIGNRGQLVSRDNFDAVIETQRNGKTLCRAMTNFVTPIAPGESIRALRLQVAGDASSAVASYAVRAWIRPWDHARNGIQKEVVIALLPGRATCVALKPLQ